MPKKIDEQNILTLKPLATVASRTSYYQEILWYNYSCHVNNECKTRILSAVALLSLMYFTNIIPNLAKQSEPYLKDKISFRRLSLNRVTEREGIQYGISLVLFFSLFIVLSRVLKINYRFSILTTPMDQNLPFDKNLTEEQCKQDIEKLAQKRNLFLKEFAITHAIYLSSVPIPLLFDLPRRIKIPLSAISFSQTFKVINQSFRLLNTTKNFYSYPKAEDFRDILNNILAATNLQVKLAFLQKDFFLDTDIVSSIFMTNKSYNAYQNHVCLSMELNENSSDCAVSFPKYYSILFIKHIIEQQLGFDVIAVDENSLMIKANKVLKCTKDDIGAFKEITEDKFSHLLTMLKFSSQYKKALDYCVEKYTVKKWSRCFDVNEAYYFSFSLNIESLGNVNELISRLRSIFENLNFNIFGSKLVAEGELKKLRKGLYNKIQNLHDSLMPSSQSQPKKTEDFFKPTREEYIPISSQKPSTPGKKKVPKIQGKHRFLFTSFKEPQVVEILWNKFKSYSQDQSPYYPLFHSSSNKVIFYSAMTLKEEDFTTKEPLKMFLGILSNGIVRTGEAAGSCIKLITHNERSSLKDKILNKVEDPHNILFKLHTTGDSRVYGVLRDEGLARYDNGVAIKVKMIEWCIIDQTSHATTSKNIVFSTHNPFMTESCLKLT